MGLSQEGTSAYEDRIEFLVESSRTSHQELLFRVKHRDDWMKIELVAQLALLGLASGIEIAGVRATSSIPSVLVLAVPTAFILAALYVVEDRLIGLLSAERGRLSQIEAQLARSQVVIPSFESSAGCREFIRKTLPIRVAAQLFSFLAIPLGLALYWFAGLKDWSSIATAKAVFDSALVIVILGLLLYGWRARLRAA